MPAKDAKTRFTGRASDYAGNRPRYPAELINRLTAMIGLRRDWIIVDMGCGTGISSEPFLHAGCRVIGVEPNPDMRRQALDALGGQERFRIVEGSAEESGLPSRCADLYVAGQALHWFDLEAASAEARRLLKPPHRAVLMWNDRRSDASLFMGAYCAFTTDECPKRAETRRGERGPEAFDRFFGGRTWTELSIRHSRDLSWEGLLGGFHSCSYAPPRDSPEAHRLTPLLRAIFDQYARGGLVRMEYELKAYVGDIA